MLSCYTGFIMNVTVRLADELVKQARHQCIDEGKSLSAWMADLVKKELNLTGAEKKSLLERLEEHALPDEYAEKEFPLEDRKQQSERAVLFQDELPS